MDETVLRWKGRFGGAKSAAILVGIGAAILLFFAVGSMLTALNNPSGPEVARIAQLVNGEIGTDRYVTLSGIAFYEAGYEETEDGQVVAQYYFLIDDVSGELVVVKAREVSLLEREPEIVTVVGMTRSTPSELRELIESDMPDIRAAGLLASSTIYVVDGEAPPARLWSVLAVVGLGLLLALCVSTWFFPTRVFAPRPVEVGAAPAVGDPGVKATGRFLRLRSVQPTIEVGRRARSFTDAVANIAPLSDGRLMIYIHHVVTVRVYGFKVRDEASDWCLLFDRNNTIDVQPGQVYGWRDRPAVRLRYRDEGGRERELILSFDNAGAQAGAVEALRRMGFVVGTGEPALV